MTGLNKKLVSPIRVTLRHKTPLHDPTILKGALRCSLEDGIIIL